LPGIIYLRLASNDWYAPTIIQASRKIRRQLSAGREGRRRRRRRLAFLAVRIHLVERTWQVIELRSSRRPGVPVSSATSRRPIRGVAEERFGCPCSSVVTVLAILIDCVDPSPRKCRSSCCAACCGQLPFFHTREQNFSYIRSLLTLQILTFGTVPSFKTSGTSVVPHSSPTRRHRVPRKATCTCTVRGQIGAGGTGCRMLLPDLLYSYSALFSINCQ
jgi:hypothetical protein